MKVEIEWIPFPKNQPNEDGDYLITLKYPDGTFVTKSYWWGGGVGTEEYGFGLYNRRVIAFANMPKAYSLERG